ncbi:MAG: M23 family metallopeptidase, partial [Desulfovibrionaceae bacterium]|nr:M23 family metallopeptidase [Desulfovibrionaceae bacterium]
GWLDSRHMGEDLGNAQRLLEDQRRQLVNLAERLTSVSRDLLRVQNFDAKLRIMMNMENDPDEVGQEPGDFSRTYLPLHRQELAARKMQDFLSRLSEAVRLEEVLQQDLLRTLRENRNTLASLPTIWPATGFVSSSFGMRSSPFGRGRKFHKGLDISNRTGTPIVATAQGTVILAARDGAYGNSVEIDHGGGIVTKYAHLQKFTVQSGQWVRRGQLIGNMGMSGRSTGPHLHYEVRLNGVPVNPMRYILE